MVRTHLHCALASAAALLLSAGASAQSTAAAGPTKDTPAAQRAADKPASGDKAAAGGMADTKAKPADPAAKEADRAARLKTEREAERQQLRAALKGPMTDALKQDLRHHAERVAKLERIRALALEAKDTATAERASKLLEKENARYEKWVNGLGAKTDTTASSQAKGGAQ